MKVSIIIAVYNVEKYIKKCIHSVIYQSYKNIEIILVNDGSIDSSGEICDEVAINDKRIKVLHKDNGGLSSARNAGIEISTGDSLFFLDSDDYLSRDCIEKCVKMMMQYNADISIMQMLFIAEDTNEEIPSNIQEKIEILNTENAIEASLYQIKFSCCAPAKLYKREVIREIRFPTSRLSEDLATCHLLMHNASSIVYSNAYGYYYRQHENSIMHVFSPRRLDALEWARNIELFCSEKYPNILCAAKCRTFNVAVHLLLDLPSKGEVHDENYNDIWNEIIRTRLITIKSKKVRFREKVAAFLSYGGEMILKKVWNSRFAIKRTEQ